MKFSEFFKYITKPILTLSLLLALSIGGLAQERRFGLEENPPTDQQNDANSSNRRYIPSELNRRFGLTPGESQLETALPKQSQISLLKTAQQMAAQGQLARAISSYQKAIAAKESLDLAYFGLGHTLMRLNKFDEAISAFKKVLTLSPNNAEAELNLGVTLYCTGKVEEAITAYQHALEIKQSPDTNFNLGLALFHQGDFAGAIEHYQQAIQQRKTYPAAYNNLGLVYEATNNFEAASTNFQLAIKQKQGGYPLAHYNLGRYYFNQGKFFPEAVAQLDLALAQQKNFPEALLILGNIYLIYETKGAVDAVEKAKSFYQQALDLRPNYPLAHENLAIAYTRLGERQAAFAQYRSAINLSHNYSSLLLENLLGSITNKNSFFINDEFSRAEGPRGFKLGQLATNATNEEIDAKLKEYEQLPQDLKALPDIHYCFGKIYAARGNWKAAIEELATTLELSQGNDPEAAKLIKAIYQLTL